MGGWLLLEPWITPKIFQQVKMNSIVTLIAFVDFSPLCGLPPKIFQLVMANPSLGCKSLYDASVVMDHLKTSLVRNYRMISVVMTHHMISVVINHYM